MKKHLSKFENDLTDSVVFQIMSEFDTQTHGGVGLPADYPDNVLRAEEEHQNLLRVWLSPRGTGSGRRERRIARTRAGRPSRHITPVYTSLRMWIFLSREGHCVW